MTAAGRTGARALGAALAASAGLNAWLLLRDPGSGRAPAPAAPAPRSAPGPAAPAGAPGVREAILDGCSRQLGAAQRELAAAQEALAQRIEPRARFQAGAREAGMEQRLAEPLRAALARVPAVAAVGVECRAEVCQLRLSAATRAEALEAWRALSRDPALGRLADGFMMEGGEPVMDAVSGRGGFDVDLYLMTRSAASAAGQLEELVAQLRASGAIERCGEAGADRGTLEARLTVVAGQAQPAVALGGSLAGTAVGRCIAERLESAAAATALPPGTKYGTVYASFPSPHGA